MIIILDESTTTDLTETTDTAEETTSSESIDESQDQSTETTQDEGQSEDSFFDPNNVPEELKPAYKQMQADYTRKTQAIAAIQKEHETLKAQAANFGRYEAYIPVIEEMLSSKSTVQQDPEISVLEKQLREQGYDDNAVELIKTTTQFLTDQFNKKEQAARQQVEQAQTTQRVNTQIEEAQNIDPRLKDDSVSYQMPDGTNVSFGKVVANLVVSDPKWHEDPKGATQRAIATVDALIGKAKVEGKQELTTLVKGKAQRFPSQASSPQSASNTNKAMSFKEAAAQAMAEIP